MTRIMRLPPASTSTRMVFAPASSAFSSSSLTTEAGRSTTSPAAMRLATAPGNIRMPLNVRVATRISFSGFLGCGLNGDAELVELVGVDCAGRFGHQVLGGRRFGEGDYFAQRTLAG